MPFATFSRNPLVSNRFTHFFHQPHYALSFYAPYIDTLPERCREIFLLNKRDGMKYKEIAERFQISVNTVDNHISKALRLIREGVHRTYMFLFN